MKSLEDIRHDNIDAARRAAIARDRAPRIICTQCDGIGHHRISEPYAVTYEVLTSSWQPTETIRESLHKRKDLVSSTALINRLQLLVSYRLAESRRSPTNMRRREWRAL